MFAWSTSLSRCWLLRDFNPAIRPLFVERNIYLHMENTTQTAILGLVNADPYTQYSQTFPFRIHPSLIDILFQQLGFLAGFLPWAEKPQLKCR